jgi:hypothetical protein
MELILLVAAVVGLVAFFCMCYGFSTDTATKVAGVCALIVAVFLVISRL